MAFRGVPVDTSRFKGRAWDKGQFDKREHPYVAHYCPTLRRRLPFGQAHRPRLQAFRRRRSLPSSPTQWPQRLAPEICQT
ncbi:hypothetical protein EMIT0P291_260049 [Pseudomonas sp. IT-P291]